MDKEIKLPFDSAELTADFQSNDPERVSYAIKTLHAARHEHCFIPVNFPEPNCLEAFEDFEDGVPEEILDKYLFIIRYYPDYEPTPSLGKIRESLVEAMIRYGRDDDHSAFSVAMMFKVDEFPDMAIMDAFRYMQDRGGFQTQDELMNAIRFTSCLLDGQNSRKITITMLREMRFFSSFKEVIGGIWSAIDEEERVLLIDDDD